MSGPAIPPEAVQAAAEALRARERHIYYGDRCLENAKLALEAAEAAWPHEPPPVTEGTTDG